MMASIEDRLKCVFADIFETTADHIPEDMSVDSVPSWDSLQTIALASSVETEFDIQLTDAELMELDSFAKLLAFVKRRKDRGDQP